MAKKPDTPLPPYFNLDPEAAAAKLGELVDTARFAKAAAFAGRGRDDLAKRGYAPDGRKRLRKFSTWEITRYLIPVAPAHLRRVLNKNPDLPQGEGASGSKWFTLEEVLKLRDHFAEEGISTKEYRPYRPEGLPAKVVAVANFKGGVGKTSTAAHLAMSAALDGYKVLVVDLDSQGSMTSILGGQVADEWQTVFPLLARDYADAVEAENKVRAASGLNAIPLDETLTEAREVSLRNVVQKTHWPNIDLIGAQLNLYWAEFQIPVWRMGLRNWALWDALTNALDQGGALDDYDIVLLDTPPALGYLTINALAAADILMVPLGASFLEFDSTGRFFDMLYSTFASIEDGENAGRRRAGLPEMKFEWDVVRALITRFDASQQSDLANVIQAYFGDMMNAYRQDYTAMVGQAGESVSGIYEADYRNFNRETYVRGREVFDRTYAEFKELLIGSWWRDQQMEQAEQTQKEDRADGTPQTA
ncbi:MULTISPECIES: AAA family ATPase [unclassified Leisingera]|uniref:AAA family ATPase n=1 Tax=unclassified Leisingera TaxID=2614906 RepID=UPI000579A8CB|nr:MULTISPECIES: AAA family ATPase [unclassified Leisingera]KIC14397.1 ATPase [Leisingera sp. ANG-DT]KIC21379.1 ATPase [Leisingera sp. ANG-S3]KIC24096.1 ATPase [Leisingera sp. ANG-M6]KIC31076.1 ATPase [Leisingera sp. ANG-S5]KIC52086.1 ATPase [Leisingera sp. ANG-S]